MDKNEYIKTVIEKYGRMSADEVRFARMRIHALPDNALVTIAYFFPAERWLALSDGERRALGADFTRRWRRDEFPELLRTSGSNSHLWFRE